MAGCRTVSQDRNEGLTKALHDVCKALHRLHIRLGVDVRRRQQQQELGGADEVVVRDPVAILVDALRSVRNPNMLAVGDVADTGLPSTDGCCRAWLVALHEAALPASQGC